MRVESHPSTLRVHIAFALTLAAAGFVNEYLKSELPQLKTSNTDLTSINQALVKKLDDATLHLNNTEAKLAATQQQAALMCESPIGGAVMLRHNSGANALFFSSGNFSSREVLLAAATGFFESSATKSSASLLVENSSRCLIKNHWGLAASRFVRTNTHEPRRILPCSTNFNSPRFKSARALPSASQVPWSKISTCPAP